MRSECGPCTGELDDALALGGDDGGDEAAVSDLHTGDKLSTI